MWGQCIPILCQSLKYVTWNVNSSERSLCFLGFFWLYLWERLLTSKNWRLLAYGLFIYWTQISKVRFTHHFVIQRAEFVKHSMFLQSLMYWQFRTRTVSEEGRKEAIGRVTDCRTSDQMGTREQEMPGLPQIYTLPAPEAICHTNRENKTRRVGGESMGSRSEVKCCGKVRKGKGWNEESRRRRSPKAQQHQLALI